MPITFQKRIRDGLSGRQRQFFTVRRSPKGTFEVDGYRFELYPLAVLAEALGRGKKQLIRWEEQGRLPKPLFEVPSFYYKNKNTGEVIKPRYYSNFQIMNLHNLLFIKYGGVLTFRNSALLDMFFADVKRYFYRKDLVPKEEFK